MAFCHGAQDGQKFLGVLLLAEALRAGRPPQLESAPLWEALLCALVMGAGTAVGGRRIIRAVGQDMTPLMPYQGFAADTAAVACLLLATAGGLPVSTTHTKTCAVMGAGAAGGGKVDRRIAGRMVLAWLLTFPACALLGYVLSNGCSIWRKKDRAPFFENGSTMRFAVVWKERHWTFSPASAKILRASSISSPVGVRLSCRA